MLVIDPSGSGISATADAEDDLPYLPTTNTTTENGFMVKSPNTSAVE